MLVWELDGEFASAGTEFADQITRFREHYDGLLELLNTEGTEVHRARTLEKDTIAPFNFVRFATHEVVFPPQPGAAVKTSSGIVEGTEGPNELRHETLVAKYDEGLVLGYLVLKYDDSDDIPHLHLHDGWRETSELPDTVRARITEIFGEPQEQ